MITPPFYPIVYVRGYAGSQGEVEDTVATPYMGFNLGSTKTRQLHTGKIIPHVFESPLIRLMKDHDYRDAYHDGQIKPEGPISPRSVWIFRYYDITSKDIGPGERKEIEFHANALREFLIHVRKAVLGPSENKDKFRVYLVAHSMGGLVCRSYLQNSNIPDLDGKKGRAWTKKGVDKFFTYATPHGGIEFRKGLGWLEGFRDLMDINNQANFGEKRMREFLDIKSKKVPVHSMNGRFPEDRIFSLVGTDSRDYGVAAGMSRRSVGPLSDGLVQIGNAYVAHSPRAFIHRSHSGHYGIVNSEGGYQNLRRFLFGNLRVKVEMEVDQLILPPKLQGKDVEASYYVETVFYMRGLPVELNRRTFEDESALLRSQKDFLKKRTKLFTSFLLAGARIKDKRNSLGYALRIQVRVPEYHKKGVIFTDRYEGGSLFSDKLNIEVFYKEKKKKGMQTAILLKDVESVKYGWDRETPNQVKHNLEFIQEGETLQAKLPFGQDTRPGILGYIALTLTPWE